MAERSWTSFRESHPNLSVPTAVVFSSLEHCGMGKKRDVSSKRSDKHIEILHLLYYRELTPGGSKGCKKQHPARMCSRQAERQPSPLIMKLYKRDWQPGEGSQSR